MAAQPNVVLMPPSTGNATSSAVLSATEGARSISVRSGGFVSTTACCSPVGKQQNSPGPIVTSSPSTSTTTSPSNTTNTSSLSAWAWSASSCHSVFVLLNQICSR